MSEQAANFEHWIRIARTGSFKDSKGREHAFTSQDFDRIVKNYDPETEESPVVLGHPKDNEPAHGWVKGLKREGEILFAQLRGLKSQLVDAVKDGSFRYVSMSLHPEGNRLRHVGFLGAVPPAITGLGPVQFNANGELTLNFSVSELGPKTEGGTAMDEKFQEMLAELHKQLAELQAKVNALTEENNAAKDALEKSKADGEKVQAEFSAYKDEVKANGRKQRLGALTSSGKVKPAEHERILGMVNALSRSDNGETVNFSSSDGGVEKVSPEEAYWRELEAREPSALMTDFSAQTPAENYQQQAKAVDLSHKI